MGRCVNTSQHQIVLEKDSTTIVGVGRTREAIERRLNQIRSLTVVPYTRNGDKLVGQIVKCQAVVNPENTFFSVRVLLSKR
ncbi:hypothetical protein SUGI_0518540 [Cryptomeria japonica]|nr:hypothetical protein SUGI_0518540 [Cryptomeria japonica]